MADPTYQTGCYRRQDGAIVVPSGSQLLVEDGGQIIGTTDGTLHSLRKRFTIAQVNAGPVAVLAARSGFKYRMTGCKMIAVGGAVAAVTTIDILGTQATASVKLVAFAQASLTQSTVLSAGGTGATVLADGASYAQNDANTAININITGSAITTATNIDVIIDYVVET